MPPQMFTFPLHSFNYDCCNFWFLGFRPPFHHLVNRHCIALTCHCVHLQLLQSTLDGFFSALVQEADAALQSEQLYRQHAEAAAQSRSDTADAAVHKAAVTAADAWASAAAAVQGAEQKATALARKLHKANAAFEEMSKRLEMSEEVARQQTRALHDKDVQLQDLQKEYNDLQLRLDQVVRNNHQSAACNKLECGFKCWSPMVLMKLASHTLKIRHSSIEMRPLSGVSSRSKQTAVSTSGWSLRVCR